MDDYEKKIHDIFNNEVFTPSSYQYAIKNALLKEKRKNKCINPFYKIVTVTCCCVFAISGMVIATYTIVNNIWNKPKEINIAEMINNTEDEISQHELVSDESIEKKIQKYLEILQISDVSNSILELRDNFPMSEEKYYILRTNEDYNKGAYIYTDISAENVLYFQNNNFDSNFSYDNISKETSIQIAKDILNKLNIWDDNYKLETYDNTNNICSIRFLRKSNNEIKNKYDFYTITFGIFNNELKVQSILNEKNNTYGNNEILVSKEEAIEIVKQKEKQFSNLVSEVVISELGIEKMNTFIYQLEQDTIEDNTNYYKVEDIARNVWIIKVKHEKEDRFAEFKSYENYKKYASKYYYVDTTTGEIIGGKKADDDYTN